MIVLAGIIKDLDRETSRTDSGIYFDSFIVSESVNFSFVLKVIFKTLVIVVFLIIFKFLFKNFISGSICVYFGPVLGQLYDEFSQSLGKFIHNILATGMLSDNLQVSLSSLTDERQLHTAACHPQALFLAFSKNFWRIICTATLPPDKNVKSVDKDKLTECIK